MGVKKGPLNADAADGQVRGNHDKTREFLGCNFQVFRGPCAGWWWDEAPWGNEVEVDFFFKGSFKDELFAVLRSKIRFLWLCFFWALKMVGFLSWSNLYMCAWLVQQRYLLSSPKVIPKYGWKTSIYPKWIPNASQMHVPAAVFNRWLEFLCVCVFVVLGSFGLFVNEVCVQHDIYRDTCARLGEPGLDRILSKILVTSPISQNTPYKEPNHSQLLRMYDICTSFFLLQ